MANLNIVDKYTEKVDIWSLGIVIVQLICGLKFENYLALFSRAGPFSSNIDDRLKSVETLIPFLKQDKSDVMTEDYLEILSRMLTVESSRMSGVTLYFYPVVEKWVKWTSMINCMSVLTL